MGVWPRDWRGQTAGSHGFQLDGRRVRQGLPVLAQDRDKVPPRMGHPWRVVDVPRTRADRKVVADRDARHRQALRMMGDSRRRDSPATPHYGAKNYALSVGTDSHHQRFVNRVDISRRTKAMWPRAEVQITGNLQRRDGDVGAAVRGHCQMKLVSSPGNVIKPKVE